MPDPFETVSPGLSAPASRAEPVDTSSDVDFEDDVPTALLVGGDGTVTGRLLHDSADRTFQVSAGYHPLRFRIIRDSTTATGIIALYPRAALA